MVSKAHYDSFSKINLTKMVDQQGFVDNDFRDVAINKLLAIPENKVINLTVT